MSKVGIDGDVLRYELGAVALEKTEVFGVTVERPWPAVDVYELVDQRIKSIIEATGADEYEVFLTGSGNFRFDLATIAPYKGNRSGLEKPYHWSTVSERLLSHWGARVVCGVEADDALAIKGRWHSDRNLSYIIASRDKDLRMVPCSHYSWACGENQPEIPVYTIKGLGEIECRTKIRINKHGKQEKSHKLVGNGLRFFYGQLLVGDGVDNIKGCPGIGPSKAVPLLQHLETEKELLEVCVGQYKLKYGDLWRLALTENAQLLWMIQDPSWVDITEEDGVLKFNVTRLWSLPDGYDYSNDDLASEEEPSTPCSGAA